MLSPLQRHIPDVKIRKTYFIVEAPLDEPKSAEILCGGGRDPQLHQSRRAVLHLSDRRDPADPSAGGISGLRPVRPQHPARQPDPGGENVSAGRPRHSGTDEPGGGTGTRRLYRPHRHPAGGLCAGIRAQRPVGADAPLSPAERQCAHHLLPLLLRHAGCRSDAPEVRHHFHMGQYQSENAGGHLLSDGGKGRSGSGHVCRASAGTAAAAPPAGAAGRKYPLYVP